MADDDAPGWTAIDDHLSSTLKRDEPDKHWGTVVGFALGGKDPLDGISAYVLDGTLLYVSYGLSDLYGEGDANHPESGYGFELTLAVPHDPTVAFPKWPLAMMQYLARYVFSQGAVLLPGQYLDGRGPADGGDTAIEGCVFTVDPILGEIETPHGSVRFLRVVGATRTELDAMQAGEANANDLLAASRKRDPRFLTDLGRDGSLFL